MPRIRTIKPEFWGSPDTAAASPRARLLYIAMWNWADDYGVGQWTERELLGFAFPNDHDVTVEDFPHIVKEVADTFGTTFYINRGRRYYAIPAWDAHQKTERRAQGKYPTPDDADSAPDQAFSSVAESVGSSAATLGSSSLGKGTGEQGNREQGTGEVVVILDDAESLCILLCDLIERNGSKRPNINKQWRDAARLMISTDKRDPDDAARLIEWCQNDSFWRANILSMPKFREKYDQLRLAAEQKRTGYQTNTEQNLAYLRSLTEQEQPARFQIEGAA